MAVSPSGALITLAALALPYRHGDEFLRAFALPAASRPSDRKPPSEDVPAVADFDARYRSAHPEIPARGFDKLTFRGGWEPTDEYLLLDGMSGLASFQLPFVQSRQAIAGWQLSHPDKIALLDVVRNARPTVLSGACGQAGAVAMLMQAFQSHEAECKRLLAQTEKRLTLPAYDYCIKSSHVFNLLVARGAISVAERTGYIARVRALARQCAERYIAERAAMGHPLMARATKQGTQHTGRTRSTAVSKRS